jgi:hypothetical protein
MFVENAANISAMTLDIEMVLGKQNSDEESSKRFRVLCKLGLGLGSVTITLSLRPEHAVLLLRPIREGIVESRTHCAVDGYELPRYVPVGI